MPGETNDDDEGLTVDAQEAAHRADQQVEPPEDTLTRVLRHQEARATRRGTLAQVWHQNHGYVTLGNTTTDIMAPPVHQTVPLRLTGADVAALNHAVAEPVYLTGDNVTIAHGEFQNQYVAPGPGQTLTIPSGVRIVGGVGPADQPVILQVCECHDGPRGHITHGLFRECPDKSVWDRHWPFLYSPQRQLAEDLSRGLRGPLLQRGQLAADLTQIAQVKVSPGRGRPEVEVWAVECLLRAILARICVTIEQQIDNGATAKDFEVILPHQLFGRYIDQMEDLTGPELTCRAGPAGRVELSMGWLPQAIYFRGFYVNHDYPELAIVHKNFHGTLPNLRERHHVFPEFLRALLALLGPAAQGIREWVQKYRS